MPQCRLHYNGQPAVWNYGGCFGFMGRHGSAFRYGHRSCTMFEYNVYEQQQARHSDVGNVPAGMNASPKDYFEWLASESPWAKYVDSLTHEGEEVRTVKIKVDCPGHAVIGTASMFRLFCHKPWLIIHWNMMVAAGCNKMIAFLLAWTFGGDREAVTRSGCRGARREQGLSDDEPMTTAALSNFSVYQMIEGTWEFNRDDNRPVTYGETGQYQQEILSSYHDGITEGQGLYHYLNKRFFSEVAVDYMSRQNAGRSSSSMGRSTSARAVRDQGRAVPVAAGAMIGVAHQLEFEYKKYGKFLHFGEGGAV